MKVFMDDVRNVPDDTWTLTRTTGATMDILQRGEVTILSLDHDMGLDCINGTKLAEVMITTLVPSKWPLFIIIHSANPEGAANMAGKFAQFAPKHTDIAIKPLPFD